MTDNDLILAEYLRISKDDGRFGESQSIENQRKIIADYIVSHPDLKGKTAVEFIDDGHTGLNFDRPAATRMLEMVRRGEIGCIIVKDFSRFSRDYIEAGDYLEQIFPFLGVRFISVTDGYDSAIHGSLAGDVGNGFKNLYNSYYSKDISRKVRTGLLAKKQSGTYTPSHCPYGYRTAVCAGISMEIDEAAALVVRRIFAMKIDGNSVSEIARVLNTEGVPSPLTHKKNSGRKIKGNVKSDNPLWAATKIGTILRDIRYTGAFAYSMYASMVMGTKKTKKLPQEKWELIPDAIPVIIPIDVFEKAQSTNRKYTYRGSEVKRPLAGKLICGGCGYALKVDIKSKTCYCGRKEFRDNSACLDAAFSLEVVENALKAAIQKMVSIVDAQRSDVNGQSSKRSNGIMQSIQSVQWKIRAASNRKSRLYDQYCDETLERSDYIQQRDEEDGVIAKLNLELSGLEKRQAEYYANSVSGMEELVAGVAWNGVLTRDITEALLEHVAVYNGGRLEIKWTFDDPFVLD